MNLSIFGFLVASASLPAQQWTTTLEPERTTIGFALGATLHSAQGTFKLKRGSIKLDPTTGAASGEIVIELASGGSGNGTRDRRMHQEILESPRFPEAVFTPDRVMGALSAEGESQIDLHGVFEIHGASHEMTLPLRVRSHGGEFHAVSRFTIPYVRWGMKNPSNFLLRVSDRVDMTVEASGRLEH